MIKIRAVANANPFDLLNTLTGKDIKTDIARAGVVEDGDVELMVMSGRHDVISSSYFFITQQHIIPFYRKKVLYKINYYLIAQKI